jgi:predicted nucleic acid-binding protein
MSADTRAFIDTNVLVYLLSADERKADIAEALLTDERLERVISMQVVNEFVNTAHRKAALGWDEIRFQVATFREACAVTIPTQQEQDEAFEIAEGYGYGWYDSLIVAAALRSGASVLLSEDLQDGQRIGALRISNPFRGRSGP